MKSTGTTLGRSTIHSWQGASPAKKAILERIQKVTRELEALQGEMHTQLAEVSKQTSASQFFENNKAQQVLHNFKAELDQLRRILWFYIEETTAKVAAGTDPEQQSKRIQQVTELLRVFAAPSANTQSSAEKTEERPASFFERLDAVIDTYMQEKKPDSPVPKSMKNTGN